MYIHSLGVGSLGGQLHWSIAYPVGKDAFSLPGNYLAIVLDQITLSEPSVIQSLWIEPQLSSVGRTEQWNGFLQWKQGSAAMRACGSAFCRKCTSLCGAPSTEDYCSSHSCYWICANQAGLICQCWKAEVGLADSKQPELAPIVVVHIVMYPTYSILFSSTASLYFSSLQSLPLANTSYRTRKSMNIRAIMDRQMLSEPKFHLIRKNQLLYSYSFFNAYSFRKFNAL